MEATILKDIINYMDFLRGCGYSISLSCFENRFEPYTTELLPHEIHLHSVCSYLKQNAKTMGKCVQNKRKLNNAQIREPLYSCCYAGVEEYVLPVIYEGKAIMCINISGYRGNLQKSKYRMEKVSELCDAHFIDAYNELSLFPPRLEHVISFAKPLEYMIIDLYKSCLEINDRKNTSQTKIIYLKAMEYIHENYMHKIRLTDFARQEGCSMHYLSAFIKANMHCSFQEYVNSVRFHCARKLIDEGGKRMLDVCMESGFSDYRYFSRAFREQCGMTPEEYSRSSRQPAPQGERLHRSVHSLERFYSQSESLALLQKFL